MGVGKREWSEKRTRAHVARRGRSSEHAPPDLGRRGGEPGGQGRARRRGSEVSCAGVVAGGDLDEAEPVRPQPWREEEGPSSLPLCRLTQ